MRMAHRFLAQKKKMGEKNKMRRLVNITSLFGNMFTIKSLDTEMRS